MLYNIAHFPVQEDGQGEMGLSELQDSSRSATELTEEKPEWHTCRFQFIFFHKMLSFIHTQGSSLSHAPVGLVGATPFSVASCSLSTINRKMGPALASIYYLLKFT